MGEADVLDEVVVYRCGSFKRVRRWLRGIHQERGSVSYGLTGWETIEEIDVIVPTKTFQVIDLTPSIVVFEELSGDLEDNHATGNNSCSGPGIQACGGAVRC